MENFLNKIGPELDTNVYIFEQNHIVKKFHLKTETLITIFNSIKDHLDNVLFIQCIPPYLYIVFSNLQSNFLYKSLRPRLVQKNPSKQLQAYKGYFISQKFNGWQVKWIGSQKKLMTSSGRTIFNPPDKWIQGFPSDMNLLGELILLNQEPASIASLKTEKGDWNNARFMVYDILDTKNIDFDKRIVLLKEIVTQIHHQFPHCPIQFIPQTKIQDPSKIYQFYRRLIDSGKEGIIMTSPKSSFKTKLQWRKDDQAQVIGYNLVLKNDKKIRLPTFYNLTEKDWQDLKKNYRLISICVKKDDLKFSVGIGFTNQQKQNFLKFYPIGSTLHYSYHGFTSNGIPTKIRSLRSPL